jgi:hypothetical protein
MLNVMAGPLAAGAPPRCPPRSCAAMGIAISRMIVDMANGLFVCIVFLLNVA